MYKRPEDIRFGPLPVGEDVKLTCALPANRPKRGIDPRIGGRMPNSWRYLIRKAEALYDFVDEMLGRMRRKRNR